MASTGRFGELDGSPKPKEEKLWGGRFEESVTDAVECFSQSVSFDKQLYKHDIMGSRAHATMLAHQDLITTSDRDKILSGLEEIENKKKCYERLERDIGKLINCKDRMNFCQLGACALAGTGLPIDRFMTSDSLGFTTPMRNSIDAVSDRNFVVEFLSMNSITAMYLTRLGEEWVLCAPEEFGFLIPSDSRLGEEWVLWALEAFGFLIPSDSISIRSSIMHQKKNPDPMVQLFPGRRPAANRISPQRLLLFPKPHRQQKKGSQRIHNLNPKKPSSPSLGKHRNQGKF